MSERKTMFPILHNLCLSFIFLSIVSVSFLFFCAIFLSLFFLLFIPLILLFLLFTCFFFRRHSSCFVFFFSTVFFLSISFFSISVYVVRFSLSPVFLALYRFCLSFFPFLFLYLCFCLFLIHFALLPSLTLSILLAFLDLHHLFFFFIAFFLNSFLDVLEISCVS